MQMALKFEMVEVHPFYATGRFAFSTSKQLLDNVHTALEVCDISNVD